MPRPQWQRNQQLAKKVQAGDRAARQTMILENQEVARHCAAQYARHADLYEDLKQVALQALISAVDRYDPKLGMASFSHYATWRIRADLSRAYDRMRAKMPIGSDGKRRKLTRGVPKALREAEANGLTMTAEDLSRTLNVDLEHAEDLLEAHALQFIQIGHQIGNDEEAAVFDVADPMPNVLDRAIEREDRESDAQTVRAALGLLSKTERKVIEALTMRDQPETYERIARVLKLTVEQVERAEVRARKKLIAMLG